MQKAVAKWLTEFDFEADRVADKENVAKILAHVEKEERGDLLAAITADEHLAYQEKWLRLSAIEQLRQTSAILTAGELARALLGGKRRADLHETNWKRVQVMEKTATETVLEQAAGAIQKAWQQVNPDYGMSLQQAAMLERRARKHRLWRDGPQSTSFLKTLDRLQLISPLALARGAVNTWADTTWSLMAAAIACQAAALFPKHAGVFVGGYLLPDTIRLVNFPKKVYRPIWEADRYPLDYLWLLPEFFDLEHNEIWRDGSSKLGERLAVNIYSSAAVYLQTVGYLIVDLHRQGIDPGDIQRAIYSDRVPEFTSGFYEQYADFLRRHFQVSRRVIGVECAKYVWKHLFSPRKLGYRPAADWMGYQYASLGHRLGVTAEFSWLGFIADVITEYEHAQPAKQRRK